MTYFSICCRLGVILFSSICFILTSCVDNPSCDNLSLSAQITDSSCDQTSGAITASAAGGNEPYMYQLDNGSFQSEASFVQLVGGVYSLTTKDEKGCQVEEEVIVSNGLTYTGDIKPIIQANCAVQGCHVSGRNITDFTVDLNAIERAANIKSQTESKNMPQPSSGLALSDAEIAKIACWADGGAPK